MNTPIPTGDIGVIVGRFQVHGLTPGHREFIDQVIKNHRKVVICLGVHASAPTKKNPMDFATRKFMIEEAYPDVVVIPLQDYKEDKVWSRKLDSKIREVFPTGKVVLYGNRDSFVKSYSGSFTTVEYEPETIVCATDIRKEVSNTVQKNPMFRAGVIYGVSNRFPICYPTVDVVAFSRDCKSILLGRKADEDKYRFIGGFIDPKDKSAEAAARREFEEETGGVLGSVTYEGSYQISDWRYKGTEDGIMTMFFSGKLAHGPVQPNDDIAELKWFDLNNIDRNVIVAGHRPLMDNFLSRIGVSYKTLKGVSEYEA